MNLYLPWSQVVEFPLMTWARWLKKLLGPSVILDWNCWLFGIYLAQSCCWQFQGWYGHFLNPERGWHCPWHPVWAWHHIGSHCQVQGWQHGYVSWFCLTWLKLTACLGVWLIDLCLVILGGVVIVIGWFGDSQIVGSVTKLGLAQLLSSPVLLPLGHWAQGFHFWVSWHFVAEELFLPSLLLDFTILQLFDIKISPG